jgi:ATP-dependent protease HslVU (ClpYQ) peptidase subunit
MTCIVGIVHNNKVYIGGDSCGSYSDNGPQHIIKTPKVFKVQEFIIGCTTSFRMIDLFTYHLEIDRSHPADSDDKFMRTSFIEGVRNCLKEGEHEREGYGGNFLVGYKNHLYEVQSDYSVLNCEDWGNAVGCGEQASRGSLYSTRNEQDPRRRVLTALEAAEATTAGVRGPFIVLQED